MKKYFYSAFACMLALLLSVSSVSAATFDTSKIDSSFEKMKQFYINKTELRTYDEIIAVEGLGLEAENYQLPDIASVDFENENFGNLSKAIISLILIGEDPKDYNGYNLVELLESYIQEDGSIEKDGYEATSNIQVWVLYALESYNSEKVNLVATNLLSTMNKDGSFGYGYGSASVDITGWCLEALTVAGLSNQLEKTKNYLNNNSRFGENGVWGYSYQDADYDEYWNPTYKYDELGNPIMIDVPNATSQAAVLMGIIVNDKEGLLNGNYNYNGVNPLDALAALQNTDGSYWDDANTSYETFDTVRGLGTYKNGSVIYKAQKDYKVLTAQPEEEQKTSVLNKDDSVQTVKKDKETKSVKTGDDTNVMVFVSVSVISGGLFLVLRKEYEKAC